LLLTLQEPVQPLRITEDKDKSVIPSLILGLTLDSESASAMHRKQAR
jgi:hypothetical protein